MRCLRDMKNMQDVTRVYGLFHIFYAAPGDRFLVSRISNHLTVEAVIMHETKGLSRVISDETNRETCVVNFHVISCAPFFSRKFLPSRIFFSSRRRLANPL